MPQDNSSSLKTVESALREVFSDDVDDILPTERTKEFQAFLDGQLTPHAAAMYLASPTLSQFQDQVVGDPVVGVLACIRALAIGLPECHDRLVQLFLAFRALTMTPKYQDRFTWNDSPSYWQMILQDWPCCWSDPPLDPSEEFWSACTNEHRFIAQLCSVSYRHRAAVQLGSERLALVLEEAPWVEKAMQPWYVRCLNRFLPASAWLGRRHNILERESNHSPVHEYEIAYIKFHESPKKINNYLPQVWSWLFYCGDLIFEYFGSEISEQKDKWRGHGFRGNRWEFWRSRLDWIKSAEQLLKERTIKLAGECLQLMDSIEKGEKI